MRRGLPTGCTTASRLALQGLATTEDGTYYLNGATSSTALAWPSHASLGSGWIPSEDEWYKAAYHKNNGVTGNYWDYPTGTNTVPSNAT